jgi:predicted nuclease of predicted toxin-antitoxin system
MKLLVDACLTPHASGVGWGIGGGAGVDVVHVNHRDRRTDSDTSLFRYAQANGMAIVTINERDFANRAAKFFPHHGVFFMPEGLSRAEQIACANRLMWVNAQGVVADEA